MSTFLDMRGAYQACDFLLLDILSALHRQGVDLNTIHQRWMRRPELTPRLADVRHQDGSSFEIVDPRHEEAVGAVVFPAADELGEVVDLVAWSPPRLPSRWLCRSALLGGENLLAPRVTDGLRVEPDVLTWLRHSCRGVVILDPVKAAPLLRRAEPLEVATVAQGQALRQALEVAPPKILVTQHNVKAAE